MFHFVSFFIKSFLFNIVGSMQKFKEYEKIERKIHQKVIDINIHNNYN